MCTLTLIRRGRVRRSDNEDNRWMCLQRVFDADLVMIDETEKTILLYSVPLMSNMMTSIANDRIHYQNFHQGPRGLTGNSASMISCNPVCISTS